MTFNATVSPCDCEDFKEGLTQIKHAQTLLYLTKGIKYTAPKFRYCPWCGKKLEEIKVAGIFKIGAGMKIYKLDEDGSFQVKKCECGLPCEWVRVDEYTSFWGCEKCFRKLKLIKG